MSRLLEADSLSKGKPKGVPLLVWVQTPILTHTRTSLHLSPLEFLVDATTFWTRVWSILQAPFSVWESQEGCAL